jgi:pantoate--beta-alanine ligase
MVIVSSIVELRKAVATARAGGKRIGFVPTMGALHRGHISLVERSRKESDVTVMSIFVNPLQFAPNEDLSRYPRPVEADNKMAKEAAVDILFRPEVRDMYPGGRSTTVAAGDLGSIWEGQSRPGHFDGVLTVVAKLFNIVQADVAVFGRKDLQQAALVSAMVRDLDFPMSIVLGPIVRESDGLALSSRNRYLIPEERRQAVVLSKALARVREVFAEGERDTLTLETAGRQVLGAESGVTEDYLAVVDPVTFKRRPRAEADFAAIVAARIGKTRLIDNMTLGANDQDR